MAGFAHDLALARYVTEGARWLNGKAGGKPDDAELDRLRRAFRREEKKDRKRARKCSPGAANTNQGGGNATD